MIERERLLIIYYLINNYRTNVYLHFMCMALSLYLISKAIKKEKFTFSFIIVNNIRIDFLYLKDIAVLI